LPIRVLIAGPAHDLTHDYWRKALSRAADIEIVGEAASLDDLARHAAGLDPAVALLDTRIERDGADPVQHLRAAAPRVAILVVSPGEGEADDVSPAEGHIGRVARPPELLAAVRSLASGGRWPADRSRPAPKATPASRDPDPGLSDRELAVLAAVARGLTNRQIARELAYSESTVKNRLSVIFSKIGVQDRTQAAIYAVTHGLVPGDTPPTT
jgi:DNA-binding NarL/FixJ family response regulator